MNIYKNIIELVGNTPLVLLQKYGEKIGAKSNIYAKLEAYNPTGSVKDRAALAMIEDGEKKGILKKGSVIIEPTSGNTGIGLAAIGQIKGYKVVLTMPDTMSIERRNLLKAYGAQLILTEGKKGMKGAIEEAENLRDRTENAIILGQFENPANPAAHRQSTGPEIWKAMEGNIDLFVAGIGTGGTITGCGEYLKSENDKIKIVGVEPASFPHKIQGIGAGFIPKVLNLDVIDEMRKVENEEAFEAKNLLAETEGLLVGISAGAALHVGGQLSKEAENQGKNIVVIFPDSGEKYLSTCGE